ncbi:MAG: acyl-ACP--UDP-N-acetylglucosamine O-acyltransferase [Candidatus Sericytochromatia bacterium]|nr:acyl-ACP--UDP-N-acetylglucosamine O-acyltransferase [Candidatus Sericytochromatia bacterium]
MIDLHPTAVVDARAVLAPGVRVGPYAVIGPDCFVGEGTVVGPHVVIEAHTTVGRDCRLHAGAVVGGAPQDLKHTGGVSYCVLGDRNTVREHVTINRATGEGDCTRLGDDNLLMAGVHVAHDCVLGNGCVLANGVTMAGHVVIEDHAVIGGMTGLHQFLRVGRLAMVGAMSRVTQDVAPFMLCEGAPPRVHGVNVVGLRRQGVPPATRRLLQRAHRLLFRSSLPVSGALAELARLGEGPELEHLVRFLQSSTRGISGIAHQEAGLEGDH